MSRKEEQLRIDVEEREEDDEQEREMRRADQDSNNAVEELLRLVDEMNQPGSEQERTVAEAEMMLDEEEGRIQEILVLAEEMESLQTPQDQQLDEQIMTATTGQAEEVNENDTFSSASTIESLFQAVEQVVHHSERPRDDDASEEEGEIERRLTEEREEGREDEVEENEVSDLENNYDENEDSLLTYSSSSCSSEDVFRSPRDLPAPFDGGTNEENEGINEDLFIGFATPEIEDRERGEEEHDVSHDLEDIPPEEIVVSSDDTRVSL